LIDLPDEERLSREFERSIKEGNAYSIGTLKIENLGAYTRKFGEKSAIVILRLVSQLIQDLIKKYGEQLFAGFLNSDEFVIAGSKDNVSSVVEEIKREFNDVLPFILQDEGYKILDVDIESLFETEELPKLQITFTESEKKERLARREEVLKSRGSKTDDIGSYTYEELQKMLGSGNINMIISRDNSGVRIRVSKEPKSTK
jgi:GGDEF domain-containing protein